MERHEINSYFKKLFSGEKCKPALEWKLLSKQVGGCRLIAYGNKNIYHSCPNLFCLLRLFPL